METGKLTTLGKEITVSTELMGGVEMAEDRKTMALKLTIEAIEAAKIAAAFKGLTLLEYASGVLLEAANRDIDESYKRRAKGHLPEAQPRPKPKGGK